MLKFLVSAVIVILGLLGILATLGIVVEAFRKPTPEKKSREINLTLNLEKGTEKDGDEDEREDKE